MTSHATCRHLRYMMTCEDFDDLYARARGRCEICGAAPEDTKHGQLHIDHDGTRGGWAVRGLLCSPCNTSLPNKSSLPSDAPEAKYLANPWVDQRFGDALVPLPEPPIGSVVGVPGKRAWLREDAGWRGMGGYRGAEYHPTWLFLNVMYGPHLLTVADPNLRRATVPRSLGHATGERIRQIAEAEREQAKGES